MSKQSVKLPTVGKDEDLKWWLDLVDRVDWTWAKTYADSAPHSYVVLGRTEGMTEADFLRAGRLIRMYGTPGKFYSMTGIYLEHNERKWWTMDPLVEDTDLINMAPTEQVYGKQTAPNTEPKHHTALADTYDNVAPFYDRMWKSQSDLDEDQAVRRMIGKHFGAYAPSVLDIGCGTGLVLDMGITAPSLYTGIDPSQGMLNELVLKHDKANIIADPAEDVDLDIIGKFDAVLCLFAAASYLKPETIKALPALSKSLLVGMCYEEGYFPDYFNEDNPAPIELAREAREAWLQVAKDHNGTVIKIGRFDVIVVEK